LFWQVKGKYPGDLYYVRSEIEISCGGLGCIIDPEGNILKTTNLDSPFATVEIDLEFSRLSKVNLPTVRA
jgi:hypothetical protein